MKKALYISQLIANAHPERVRLLFQSHGIKAPVNAKSIMDAYLVLGDPFLLQLFEIAYAGSKVAKFSNYDGPLDTSGDWDPSKIYDWSNSATEGLDEGKKKSGFWQGFKNIFESGGDIISGIAGAYNTVSQLLGNTGIIDTDTTNQTEAQLKLQQAMYQMQLEQQKAAAADKTKTYLLIGAGVLVVILVLIMFLKK